MVQINILYQSKCPYSTDCVSDKDQSIDAETKVCDTFLLQRNGFLNFPRKPCCLLIVRPSITMFGTLNA